jgi:hypothetical protein
MPALSELRDSPAGQAVAEAWRWWIGELLAMVPERFRHDRGKRPTADIKPGPDAVEVEIVRDGVGQLFADPTKLEDLQAEGWAELAALIEGSRARIVLRPPDVFVTRVILPKAARRRLKSAVALQLSQVSPVEPALLRWAVSASDEGAERIDGLADLFEANGIAPPPICAVTADSVVELAPGRRLHSAGAIGLLARPGLVAALLIATIPVTTVIGATLLRASAEGRIERLEKGAAPKLKTEARTRRYEALRRDLRPLATKPGVTATLEDLAARLPLTDHVKTVQQGNDRILTVTVETPDSEAAQASLEGSRLLPHVATADIVPSGSGRLAVTLRTSPR